MSYSLHIRMVTWIDPKDYPQLSKGYSSLLSVSETIIQMHGWEFAESIVPGYCSQDNGEIDSEDLLELYKEYCEHTGDDLDEELMKIIENSSWGIKAGDSFFEYSQSY